MVDYKRKLVQYLHHDHLYKFYDTNEHYKHLAIQLVHLFDLDLIHQDNIKLHHQMYQDHHIPQWKLYDLHLQDNLQLVLCK